MRLVCAHEYEMSSVTNRITAAHTMCAPLDTTCVHNGSVDDAAEAKRGERSARKQAKPSFAAAHKPASDTPAPACQQAPTHAAPREQATSQVKSPVKRQVVVFDFDGTSINGLSLIHI